MYAIQAWKKIQRDANDVNTVTQENAVEGSILSTALLSIRPPTDMTSLWILGPSGIGKTTWALTYAEKPSLFVRHLDTLRQYRCGYHQSLIFDDMSFSHLPRQAQIALVDRFHPQQIHIRYSVVNLPANIQKIFLSNDTIFTTPDEAIYRRITLINLY